MLHCSLLVHLLCIWLWSCLIKWREESYAWGCFGFGKKKKVTAIKSNHVSLSWLEVFVILSHNNEKFKIQICRLFSYRLFSFPTYCHPKGVDYNVVSPALTKFYIRNTQNHMLEISWQVLNSYLQNYNAVNYDEKVMDGFYDVYGITANSVVQGKMPLLVDLQAISVLDNVDYEVILVDRMIDPDLRELEDKAYSLSMEYQVSDQLTILDGLVQKIADMVVERMGGPVGDADEMLKRWTIRSYELRSSLNTIILPLGRLDIGLSRHRALLFKVLTVFTFLYPNS